MATSFKDALLHTTAFLPTVDDEFSLSSNRSIFFTAAGVIYGRVCSDVSYSEGDDPSIAIMNKMYQLASEKSDPETRNDCLFLRDVSIVSDGGCINYPFMYLFLDSVIGTSIGDFQMN